LTGSPTTAAGAAATLGLRPDQALRIDTKLNDGSPDTGEVRAFGGATCGVAGAAGTGGTYTTTTTNNVCGLYIHFQAWSSAFAKEKAPGWGLFYFLFFT
jgi:hypothetical protein